MTTDTCRDIEGLLARAGDGALDAGDRQRLQTHLDACASCRAAVDEQRAVRFSVAIMELGALGCVAGSLLLSTFLIGGELAQSRQHLIWVHGSSS